MNDFKPGIYKHYKGGLYTAIGLTRHHDSRRKMVLYFSHDTGSLNVRELESAPGVSAWNDVLEGATSSTGLRQSVRRFTFLKETQ